MISREIGGALVPYTSLSRPARARGTCSLTRAAVSDTALKHNQECWAPVLAWHSWQLIIPDKELLQVFKPGPVHAGLWNRAHSLFCRHELDPVLPHAPRTSIPSALLAAARV